MLIDTHCHIQFNAFSKDYQEVIDRCRMHKMLLIAVGSQYETSLKALEFAEKYPEIYASIGLHPIHLFSTDVDEEEIKFKSREEVFDYDKYKKIALHPKIVAIGECGLELYHLPKNIDANEALNIQKEAFFNQYNLANDANLPLIIHVRDAHKEMINLLNSLSLRPRGVVHCFTGNWQIANQYLEMDLYLGFTGVITFREKKTNPNEQRELIDVVKKCPLNRMLVETDSPYLAPQAYRGKRAEPWMVSEVINMIAKVKNMDPLDVSNICSENALKLFTKIKQTF